MRTKLLVAVIVAAIGSLIYFFFVHGDSHRLSWFEAEKENPRDAQNALPLVDSSPQVALTSPSGSNEDFFTSKISFDLVKQKAESGDAVAQRLLSDMYEDCMAYSVSPQGHLGWLDHIAKTRPDSLSHIERIKKETVEFCRKVDGGAPIPADAYKLWLKQSADSGDLTAQIRHSVRSSGDRKDADIESLAKKTMSSRDPEALYELSNLLAGREIKWSNEEDAKIFGNQYSQRALTVAACKSGMSCGGNSRIMRQVCTSTFRCGYSNYEQFVYAELATPAERREIENLANTIAAQFSH